MIKKRKLRIALQIYLSIIVFLLSFFTIYAYRNDVMDYLINKGEMQINDPNKEIIALNKELRNIEPNTKNMEQITKILTKHLKDYSYTLFTYQYSAEGDQLMGKHFLMTDGGISQQAIKYSSYADIQFARINTNIYLYPKFTDYLNKYRIIATILALAITALVYFLVKHISSYNKLIKRINKYFKFKKLSINLMIINITSGIIAVSMFTFMNLNQYAFFDFLKETDLFHLNHDTLIANLKDELSEYEMTEKNRKPIIEILDKYTDYSYNIYLTDGRDRYFAGQTEASDINKYIRTNIAVGSSSVTTPEMLIQGIKVKGGYASITIYSHPLLKFILPYMVTIGLISVSLWLMPLLYFIRRKVFEIKVTQEDVNVLSTGDWSHPVSVFGSDEIGALGNDINQMRVSFLENLEKEEMARNSNNELITSLSHDLRTPLTSLMGYLDIIHYEKCSEEEKKEYIEKSIRKAEQIRSLSDKMFEYFLIYGKEETVDLIPQSIEEFMDYIKECTILLQQQGYKFKIELCPNIYHISINMPMIKRVMDNLYSNLQKYADKEEAIVIMSEVRKDRFNLMISNKKREDSNNVESNNIGLKSVKKIVEMHHGELFTHDENDCFMIVLSFPLVSEKKNS